MSRMPLIAPEAAQDPVVQRVYREIEQELGFGIVPNVFRAMANSPGFLEANWNAFRATVLKGRLPRLLKEMVGVVVSAVHDSPYARLVHLHSLGVQGLDKEALAVLSAGDVQHASLSAATVETLRFARQLARAPRQLTAADFEALERVGLGREDVLEVVAAIQLFTAVNLFTDALDVPVDAI